LGWKVRRQGKGGNSVYPPDDEAVEGIDEAIHQLTFDILLNEGYHISVLVFEPDSVGEWR